MLFLGLLASVISNKKSAIIWVIIHFLCIVSVSSVYFQDVLFIFSFQQFISNVLRSGFFQIYPAWGSMKYLNL